MIKANEGLSLDLSEARILLEQGFWNQLTAEEIQVAAKLSVLDDRSVGEHGEGFRKSVHELIDRVKGQFPEECANITRVTGKEF